MISTIQEGVLLEFICPGLREALRDQKERLPGYRNSFG